MGTERYKWTIGSIQRDLGLSFATIRELLEKGYIVPEGWDEMDEARRMDVLASGDAVVYATNLEDVCRMAFDAFLKQEKVLDLGHRTLTMQYEILAETKRLRSLFDLSTQPMDLKDVAESLPGKYSKDTLNNYIEKTGSATGLLLIPKKNPVLKIPVYKSGGKWLCNRFEFIRELHHLSYDKSRILKNGITSKLDKSENDVL